LGYVAVLLLFDISYKDFINYSVDDFSELSKGKLVLLDIKGIYNNSIGNFKINMK